ncbi:hypothetical protein Tco_1354188 [Tanacetum coccineum]
MKSRRVQAVAMTIQYGVRGMILAVQSEAFKTYLLGGAIDGSEANGIIRDPKLELESSRFTFDLVPLSYESVDVVVGENWLLRHKAEMVCHEKVVKMPWSCKVRVGSNGNLWWEASVLLGRKKGGVHGDDVAKTVFRMRNGHVEVYGYAFWVNQCTSGFHGVNEPGGVRVAREDDRGVTEGREDVREVFQQRGSGAKRKLSRCGRNQMGNEPILALPEGADDFVVYYDARSKDLEACLEKGRRFCLIMLEALSERDMSRVVIYTDHMLYRGVGRRSEAKNEFEIDVRRSDLGILRLSIVSILERIDVVWFEVNYDGLSIKGLMIVATTELPELEKAVKERDELKDKIAKWEESTKNLEEILKSQMSARDKTGLGYSTQLNELSSNHETDSENSLSIFDGRSSDDEHIPENDKFSKNRYKVVPPPITRNFLTPTADISFAGLDEYAIRNKIIESQTTKLNTKTSETAGKTNDANTEKPKSVSDSVVSNPKINRDSVIIEDWTSYDEEEVSRVQKVRHENQTVNTKDDKSGQNSHKQGVGFRKVKVCFVCRSTEHLIKDYNFHDKKSQESNLKNVVNTGQSKDLVTGSYIGGYDPKVVKFMARWSKLCHKRLRYMKAPLPECTTSGSAEAVYNSKELLSTNKAKRYLEEEQGLWLTRLITELDDEDEIILARVEILLVLNDVNTASLTLILAIIRLKEQIRSRRSWIEEAIRLQRLKWMKKLQKKIHLDKRLAKRVQRTRIGKPGSYNIEGSQESSGGGKE